MTSVGLVVTRGEAGFGEGDREAAVGNVVGGFDDAFGSESNEAVDGAFRPRGRLQAVHRQRWRRRFSSIRRRRIRGRNQKWRVASGEWRVTQTKRDFPLRSKCRNWER